MCQTCSYSLTLATALKYLEACSFPCRFRVWRSDPLRRWVLWWMMQAFENFIFMNSLLMLTVWVAGNVDWLIPWCMCHSWHLRPVGVSCNFLEETRRWIRLWATAINSPGIYCFKNILHLVVSKVELISMFLPFPWLDYFRYIICKINRGLAKITEILAEEQTRKRSV